MLILYVVNVSFLNRGHHFKFSRQSILSWHPTLCFCEFFLLLTVTLSSSKSEIRYCLNCVHNCDDHSSLDSKSAVQHMKYFIYHFTKSEIESQIGIMPLKKQETRVKRKRSKEFYCLAFQDMQDLNITIN